MKTEEILSGIAIAISLFALYQSNKASKNSLDRTDIQNLIAVGSLESQIAGRISSTRSRIADLTPKMAQIVHKGTILNPDEAVEAKAFTKVYNEAIEQNLNAYEEACRAF
ncbi:MAG TPA: hypothetical protein VEC36_06900 [Patescibacteria group bacterium]|nr:hypothetical protein [Patescibacteria group bacterium]